LFVFVLPRAPTLRRAHQDECGHRGRTEPSSHCPLLNWAKLAGR
jgi:hypothetical protein